MEKIRVVPYDDVYVRIICDMGVANDLSDHFSFLIPNSQFHPKVKARFWDGRIRLFSTRTNLIYAGLRKRVEEYCQENGYEYEEDASLADSEMSKIDALSLIPAESFKFEPRAEQLKGYIRALRARRGVFLLATGTGKSFLIHLLQYALNLNTLIIVPTLNLVHQMAADLESYDNTGVTKDEIYKIYANQDKNVNKRICISTWQSLKDLPKEWFDKFDLVIGDEAHGFTANKLTGVMEKLVDCPYKIGVTGTLSGQKTHSMVLEGLFGPVQPIISTAEAIKNKTLSKLTIKTIVLRYPDEVCSQFRNTSFKDPTTGKRITVKPTWPDEINFIEENEKRNKFIAKLAHSLEGNVLVLFQHIKHGDSLKESIEMLNRSDRKIYYIHGQNTKGEERFELQEEINSGESSITIAGDKVFSVGVNIPNLNYIIFASAGKARIKTLQSIGRVLRRTEQKKTCTLFDLTDYLVWKNRKNFALLHYIERLKYYNEEKLEYKSYTVEIK